MTSNITLNYWKTKRTIKHWLLENNTSKLFWAIAILLVWTAIRRFFLAESFRNNHDYFTSIFYFIVILWVYYTICFRLILDEDTDEKIILKRRLYDVDAYKTSFIQLTILFLFGTRSFLINEKAGVIIILSIITITALLAISYLFYNSREKFSEIVKNKFKGNSIGLLINTIGPIVIYSSIIVYVYLFPWKTAFCSQYGIEEIGNYFEKDSYKAKYIVNISRIDDDKTYSLPAEIFVSDRFSEYESYESTRGVGAYETESDESEEIRYVKVNKVFFKNGGYLYFNDCLVSVKNSQECVCTDQDGDEWNVEMTKTKTK